jgi:hypothetical protein
MASSLIPLDASHEILSVFGIGPYSKGYQRWKRDDGLMASDLLTVLCESPWILIMDWRGCLQDAVDEIVKQLGLIGIEATADLDNEGNEGYLAIGQNRAGIKYVPVDNDDFDAVIESVNGLV